MDKHTSVAVVILLVITWGLISLASWLHKIERAIKELKGRQNPAKSQKTN